MEKNNFNNLLELFTKGNQLLNIIYQDNIDKYRSDRIKFQTMTKQEAIDYRKNNFIYEK